MQGTDGKDQRQRVLELFEEGKRFTEELLQENERLRHVAARLRQDNRELESRYLKTDVPRLVEKNSILEQEVQELREQVRAVREEFATVEEENREFAERYVQIERQNSDLINLYVASYRLHSTLVYAEVVEIVKEIVINMVGAEVFGVYVLEEAEGRLVRVAHEGLDASAGEALAVGEGRIGAAAATGTIYVAPAVAPGQVAASEPIACIPLKIDERVIGVIAIHRLLVQKDGFQPVDYELFELLGGHAATALYGSTLYCLSERKRTTLQGFLDLLKNDGGAPARGA